ncbi:DNA cytosine methyltransferase [Ruegeria sp. HKCCD6157]|uniref:DNA cytosine methyltransferase n=1 Tax=Ruegeria sp. HKCCD6157 TaxID=2690707 RepID=UPI001492C1D2|nr:DNA cytosine methyltransferase [Ruegeria sp. HKCCD6157]NOE25129.1 DNA (cytosine-5-)-methyltransferase [Ruegeria sp. HKCCD6157]
MPEEFAIIDLFAGPGGLGEGFSQAGHDPGAPMKIKLSIEMDDHAIQTLQLRAFLRSFDEFPQEYRDALNSGLPLPDWADLYPINWKLAKDEARQRVLGEPGVFEELAVELDRTREDYNGNTILIGGPPCQAYSLVGRARNKGKAGYVPEDDHRHFLYREYVRILDRLRPAAFVMENVKGMLSSQVDGGGIFSRVLDDLEAAGDGYLLLPLSKPAPSDGSRAAARDFLIKAEYHGVPQARHRVIILGIRSDHAKDIEFDGPILGNRQTPVTVAEVLRDLPRVRSGLSRGDDADAWLAAVQDQASAIAASDAAPREVREIARAVAGANRLPRVRSSTLRKRSGELPAQLADWLLDDRLEVVLQHETRGHIPDDLGRYLFSSAFTRAFGRSPKLAEFPEFLQPAHRNRGSGDFADRFRTQCADRPSTTVTSHISKDGHYFIHPDTMQCRSLTVREAARLQTFPDNYLFCGPRTKQYHQVGNAVPPYLAFQIAKAVRRLLG